MGAAESILIIEDDPEIAHMLRSRLESEGYSVRSVVDGKDGLKEAKANRPSLILLDLTLPGLNGLEICRELRREADTRQIPVIMVTAHADEVDVTVGLEIGADDYIGKPFSLRQLVARIRALLRRAGATRDDKDTASAAKISIDTEAHEARYAGKLLSLTQAEFNILATLTSAPGRTFTREQLIETISTQKDTLEARNIDVHVNALRKKLGEGRLLIETIRGIGYRLKA